MADDGRPPVGTVAEEAARLLDALGGWASSSQAGYAAGSASEAGAPDDGGQEDHGSAAHSGAHPSRCDSCGADTGVGQAVTCQLCPVCQGIGLLRSVRPETVDRLADLAGAVATTLRDLAGQRRRADDGPGTRGAGPGAGAGAGAASSSKRSGRPESRTRVQDIVVDDEDDQAGSATS